MHKFIIPVLSLILALTVNAQDNTTMEEVVDNSMELQMRPADIIVLETTEGDITIALYEDTPGHRANFLSNVEHGIYDDVLFHRVIDAFMVQTGEQDTKTNPDTAAARVDPNATIPAEIVYPRHFHKYGAVAAARTADQVNPERRSSATQFYIVTGQKYTPEQLLRFEAQVNNERKRNYFGALVNSHMEQVRALQAAGDTAALDALQQQLIAQTEANVPDQAMPAEVVEAYTTIGGTPHLDGAYTVFGEVIDGMDVVEKIQKAATDATDRPLQPIRIIRAYKE